MAYVTLTQIRAALPQEITHRLIDDTGAGVPDSENWNAIAEAVGREIDGKIGQRYATPLPEPVPAIVANAAFVLAAELLYQRRGFYGEKNPWAVRAQGIRGTLGVPGGQAGLLDAIASGDSPLTVASQRAIPTAVAITEPARSVSRAGRLMT